MNKKAQVLKFIVVSIIAVLIIFVPSCGLSKVLRVSGEAKENYNTFVNEIYDTIYNSDEDDNIRNYGLIMDSESVLAYFSSSQIVVDMNSAYGNDPNLDYADPSPSPYDPNLGNRKVIINRPAICDPTQEDYQAQKNIKGCFCLFSSVRVDESRINNVKQFNIVPLKANCRKVEFEVDFNKQNYEGQESFCGVGIPLNLQSYTCSGGFFIDRDVICPGPDDQNFKKVCLKNSARRINILIQKAGENKALINEQ